MYATMHPVTSPRRAAASRRRLRQRGLLAQLLLLLVLVLLPSAVSYAVVGSGFCRAGSGGTGGSVNGWRRDDTSRADCEAACSADVECVGYAHSTKASYKAGRCYVHGTLSMGSGWSRLKKTATWIGSAESSSGCDGSEKCCRRKVGTGTCVHAAAN